MPWLKRKYYYREEDKPKGYCNLDAGYLSPDEIAGRVKATGRGGTILQPGIDCLENAKDFPAKGKVFYFG